MSGRTRKARLDVFVATRALGEAGREGRGTGGASGDGEARRQGGPEPVGPSATTLSSGGLDGARRGQPRSSPHAVQRADPGWNGSETRGHVHASHGPIQNVSMHAVSEVSE